MNNTREAVWKILDNSPCIRRTLSHELINIRALARYLCDEYEIDATLDAVINAIRRYRVNRYNGIIKRTISILKETSISTRSRLANIALIKDEEVQNLLPQLFSIIQYNRGDVLRIIQADESMKILIDEKNLDKVRKILPEKKIIKVDTNLAELNMHFPNKAVNTLGIAGVLTNNLAINDINVLEIISCAPEMLFFVKEKDVSKAHNIIYQLCSV